MSDLVQRQSHLFARNIFRVTLLVQRYTRRLLHHLAHRYQAPAHLQCSFRSLCRMKRYFLHSLEHYGSRLNSLTPHMRSGLAQLQERCHGFHLKTAETSSSIISAAEAAAATKCARFHVGLTLVSCFRFTAVDALPARHFDAAFAALPERAAAPPRPRLAYAHFHDALNEKRFSHAPCIRNNEIATA